MVAEPFDTAVTCAIHEVFMPCQVSHIPTDTLLVVMPAPVIVAVATPPLDDGEVIERPVSLMPPCRMMMGHPVNADAWPFWLIQ